MSLITLVIATLLLTLPASASAQGQYEGWDVVLSVAGGRLIKLNYERTGEQSFYIYKSVNSSALGDQVPVWEMLQPPGTAHSVG